MQSFHFCFYQGDKLGEFELTTKGHGKCVEYVKQFNLPLLLLGGGGYTVENVARCWTYETAIAVGTEISKTIPLNNYYNYFENDYKLHTTPKKRYENLNSEPFLLETQYVIFLSFI